MDADSTGAGVYAAVRAALVRAVCAHPAIAPLRTPHGFGSVFDPWMGVESRIAGALPRLLAHPALRSAIGAFVVEALTEGADAPTWGTTHRMLPLHVLDGIPGIEPPGAQFDVPLSGDDDTVRCTGSSPGVTDRSWRGSVARWAWDLADREESLWSVPFGASGDPASPHFGDQHPAWVDVRPTRIITDWSALAIDDPAGAA